jgi:hypothetical protein
MVRYSRTKILYCVKETNIIQSSLDFWNRFLVSEVQAKKLPVTIFTPNQHYANHLPDMIRKLGPPIGYSTRCLERTIGVYKQRLRSTIDPGAEASNVLIKLAATNYQNLMNQDSNGMIDCNISGDVISMEAKSAALETVDFWLPNLLDVTQAQQDDIITIGSEFIHANTTFTTTSSRTNYSRTDHMIALKVKVQK